MQYTWLALPTGGAWKMEMSISPIETPHAQNFVSDIKQCYMGCFGLVNSQNICKNNQYAVFPCQNKHLNMFAWYIDCSRQLDNGTGLPETSHEWTFCRTQNSGKWWCFDKKVQNTHKIDIKLYCFIQNQWTQWYGLLTAAHTSGWKSLWIWCHFEKYKGQSFHCTTFEILWKLCKW